MNLLMVEKMPVSLFCMVAPPEDLVCSTSECFLLALVVRAGGVVLLGCWDALRTLSLIVPKVTCKTARQEDHLNIFKTSNSRKHHACRWIRLISEVSHWNDIVMDLQHSSVEGKWMEQKTYHHARLVYPTRSDAWCIATSSIRQTFMVQPALLSMQSCWFNITRWTQASRRPRLVPEYGFRVEGGFASVSPLDGGHNTTISTMP